MIPVLVINLARSDDRRAMIGAKLDALGVPYSFFQAIDAQALSDEEIARLCPTRAGLHRRWPLSRGEVACAASHRAVLQKIVDGGDDFACVLEDDAVPAGNFREFLDSVWLRSLPRFDILKLASDSAGRKDFLAVPVAARAGAQICVPLRPSYSARAYIVSQSGARRTLARSGVVVDTADVFLFRRPAPTARILDVRPIAVMSSRQPTTLGGDQGPRASKPWWWRIASWGPHRLALADRFVRRYLAFFGSQGIGGLARLQRIPFVADAPRPR